MPAGLNHPELLTVVGTEADPTSDCGLKKPSDPNRPRTRPRPSSSNFFSLPHFFILSFNIAPVLNIALNRTSRFYDCRGRGRERGRGTIYNDASIFVYGSNHVGRASVPAGLNHPALLTIVGTEADTTTDCGLSIKKNASS